MIKVNCKRCGTELEEQGALVISPPRTSYVGTVGMPLEVWDKQHVCITCWNQLEEWVLTPHSSIKNYQDICREIVLLDAKADLASVPDWKKLAQKARQAISFKDGSIIPK